MHVAIDFGRAFQSRNPRIFDYDGVHPNIKKIKTAVHWANEMRYLGKEDKDNKDLVEKTMDFRLVANCESIEYALATGVKPLDAKILFEHTRGHNFKLKPVEKPEATWIEKLDDLINGDYYDKYRNIFWFQDGTGNSKKTHFVKWCMYLMEQGEYNYLVMRNISNFRDTMMTIDEAVKAGWTGKYCIIDLPRTFNHDSGMYTALEAIKDGIVHSTKYHCKCPYRIPDDNIVVVLSNGFPDVYRMSLDKWKVICIHPDKSVTTPHPMEVVRMKKEMDEIEAQRKQELSFGYNEKGSFGYDPNNKNNEQINQSIPSNNNAVEGTVIGFVSDGSQQII